MSLALSQKDNWQMTKRERNVKESDRESERKRERKVFSDDDAE